MLVAWFFLCFRFDILVNNYGGHFSSLFSDRFKLLNMNKKFNTNEVYLMTIGELTM